MVADPSNQPAPGQLSTSRTRNSSCSNAFITSCPPGKMDPLGMPPTHKVRVRPPSGNKRSKPTALDKHLRHVVLLQRRNRARAAQEAAAAAQQQQEEKALADWSHQLRSAILGQDAASSLSPAPAAAATAADGDDDAGEACVCVQRSGAGGLSTLCKHAPTAGVLPTDCTAATATAVQGSEGSTALPLLPPAASVIASWQPVATAAATLQQQTTAAQQRQQVLGASHSCLTQPSLGEPLDPDTLRPSYAYIHSTAYANASGAAGGGDFFSRAAGGAGAGGGTRSGAANSSSSNGSAGGSAAADDSDETGVMFDADAFLDGLLQKASAARTPAVAPPKAGTSKKTAAAAAADVAAAADNTAAESNDTGSTTQHQQQPVQKQRQGGGVPGSKRRPCPPAWALSEQQQAAAAAAAEEEEEAVLLGFAAELDLQSVLEDLGDDELLAMFKELRAAEQQQGGTDGNSDAATAAAAADADVRWRRCFVAALNAAAMRGIAATGGAAGTAGPQQHDMHSAITSANSMRRAEAAAARRQKLMRKLAVLQAAGAGLQHGPPAQVAAGAAGAEDLEEGWDRATSVASGSDDVGRIKAAVKHLEAGEVLGDNPEMKAVHSAASVRSMLSKLELAAAAAGPAAVAAGAAQQGGW